MKRLILALAILVSWGSLGWCQTQLPVRFGANGAPLTPFQQVNYFGWLAPNATLPSELVCAQEIGLTSEGIPTNPPMNATIPTGAQISAFIANPQPSAGGNPTLTPTTVYNSVTGDYPSLLSVTPSTDMIIRWAACKNGIDEDTLRAQMWEESNWRMDTAGDVGANQAACIAQAPSSVPLTPAIYNTTTSWLDNSENMTQGGCFQSYGFGQEKVIYLATIWPMVKDSTAFAADYRALAIRGCVNGQQVSWFQTVGKCTATQAGHGNCDTDFNSCVGGSSSACTDLQQGCVASHFSGDWWSPAAAGYWSSLSGFLSTKPWPGGL